MKFLNVLEGLRKARKMKNLYCRDESHRIGFDWGGIRFRKRRIG